MKILNVRAVTVCAVAALFLLHITGCDKEKAPEKKEVVRPAKTMLVPEPEQGQTFRFPGKVQAGEEADLAFRVSGTLINLPVKEGRLVEKNALVARLDPRDFETEVARVESQLHEAQAELKAMEAGARHEDLLSLEAQVSAARATFQEANLQAQRKERLFQDRFISKMEYDNAMAQRDVAQAQLDNALQQLEIGKTGARQEEVDAMRSRISGLHAQLKRANDALSDTFLRAPFAGVISRRYVDNHQDVQAKSPIVKLQNAAEFVEIVIHVPEHLVMKKNSYPYELFATFEALPGLKLMLETEPVEVANEADPQTKTFEITLRGQAPETANIWPGMTATVSAKVKAENNGEKAYLLPVQAVFADAQNQKSVWSVDPTAMTVSKRPVTVGRVTGKNIEVTSGLKTGERVVTAGVHYLVEGQKIRLIRNKEGR